MGLLQTLEQDKMWYGEDGFPYVIEEMETSHIENVIRFLGRRAKNIYRRHRWAEERAAIALDVEWNAGPVQIESDALEWLAQRPLLQKLEQVLKVRQALTVEPLQLEGPNAGVMVVKHAEA